MYNLITHSVGIVSVGKGQGSTAEKKGTLETRVRRHGSKMSVTYDRQFCIGVNAFGLRLNLASVV